MLRRMSRRVQSLHADVAHHEDVAVPEQAGPLLGGEQVLPVGVTVVGEKQGRPAGAGQLPGAGDEVGVDVRLGDVRDPQTLLLRRSQVGVHPAVGIHDHRLARGRATDQIRGLGQLVVVKAPEQHRLLLWGRQLAHRPSSSAESSAHAREAPEDNTCGESELVTGSPLFSP